MDVELMQKALGAIQEEASNLLQRDDLSPPVREKIRLIESMGCYGLDVRTADERGSQSPQE